MSATTFSSLPARVLIAWYTAKDENSKTSTITIGRMTLRLEYLRSFFSFVFIFYLRFSCCSTVDRNPFTRTVSGPQWKSQSALLAILIRYVYFHRVTLPSDAMTKKPLSTGCNTNVLSLIHI